MADSTSPSPPRSLGDRIKSGATILGAVAGTLTAVYGVYEKARTEARSYTATSYNMLAPQINQMNDAVKQLQLENQQLRQIVADFQGKPRIGETPPAAARRPAPTRRPSAAAVSKPPGAPANPPPVAEVPASPPPASGAPPPAEAPAPAAPAAEAPAAEDPVSGLLKTVGRTRQAIESLRKVPEDFEKVVKP